MALTKIIPGGHMVETSTSGKSVVASTDPIERHKALTKSVELVKKQVTELQAQKDLLTQQRADLETEAKEHNIESLESLPVVLQQYEDYAMQLITEAEEKLKKAQELLGIE